MNFPTAFPAVPTPFRTLASRPVVPAGPTQEDLDAEYIRICQSYDPTSDEWTVDRYNRRWIMCTVCGRIKQDAQMSYYAANTQKSSAWI